MHHTKNATIFCEFQYCNCAPLFIPSSSWSSIPASHSTRHQSTINEIRIHEDQYLCDLNLFATKGGKGDILFVLTKRKKGRKWRV